MVSLKTVGLLANPTAQSGLHIPAELGQACRALRRRLRDIGDEQSIEQPLSTFRPDHPYRRYFGAVAEAARPWSSWMRVGGNGPDRGAALAKLILRHCLLDAGVYCIATTTLWRGRRCLPIPTTGGNVSVEFDLQTLQPTYRLLIGDPGRAMPSPSNGLGGSRRR